RRKVRAGKRGLPHPASDEGGRVAEAVAAHAWNAKKERTYMEKGRTDELLKRAAGTPSGRALAGRVGSGAVTLRKGLAGSADALYCAAAVERKGGVHLVVCEDRDAAAYLMNDFYALLGEEGMLFFPAGYKRSVQFGQEDASGIVQRTAALGALRGFDG